MRIINLMLSETFVSADIVVNESEAVALKPLSLLSTGIAWIFAFGAVCIGLQVVAIWISAVHPVFELASHFAMHGVCIGLLIVPGLILFRKRRLASVLTASLAYLIFLVQPWNLYLSQPVTPSSQQTRTIKVLSWNLLVVNQSYAAIDALIEQADADVVLLIETPPDMLEQLPGVVKNYPLSQIHPHWNGGGICMFSRLPETQFEFNNFGVERMPAIVASIPTSPSASLRLVGIHTLSPHPVSRTYARDQQLRGLADWAQATDAPLCVFGDINTTPWTASFNALLRAGLIDTRVGVGNCPSWPSPLGPLGIPIDHVMYKGACAVSQRRVLSSSPGSDHSPVTFTLHY